MGKWSMNGQTGLYGGGEALDTGFSPGYALNVQVMRGVASGEFHHGFRDSDEAGGGVVLWSNQAKCFS